MMSPTTEGYTPAMESDILDFIADACARYRLEGKKGSDWTYLMTMSAQDRLAFDLFLVRTKDPLAWQARTTLWRFSTLIARMVDSLYPCHGPVQS